MTPDHRAALMRDLKRITDGPHTDADLDTWLDRFKATVDPARETPDDWFRTHGDTEAFGGSDYD